MTDSNREPFLCGLCWRPIHADEPTASTTEWPLTHAWCFAKTFGRAKLRLVKK